MMHLNQLKQLQSGYHDMHCFTMQIKAPSNAPFKLQDFLMAASVGSVCYSMGRFEDAADSVNQMLEKSDEKDVGFLICLKRYLTILADGYDSEYGKKVISYFHDSETSKRLCTLLDSNKNPFDDYTLHCDKNCDETCPLRPYCFLNNVDNIAQRLDYQMSLLDFDRTAQRLKNIL